MIDQTHPALPTIHMNGTSKEMLLSGWKEVVRKVRDLESAIEGVEFNGRDYYPRGDQAFPVAREEFAQAMSGLRQFTDFAKTMRNGIAGGGFRAE